MEPYNISYSFRGIREGHVCGKSATHDANNFSFYQSSFMNTLRYLMLNKAHRCLCKDSCRMDIFDRVQFFSHETRALIITVAKLPSSMPAQLGESILMLNANNITSDIPEEDRNLTFVAFLRSKFTAVEMVESDYRCLNSCLINKYKGLKAHFQLVSIDPYSLYTPPAALLFADANVYAEGNIPAYNSDDLACIISSCLISGQRENDSPDGVDRTLTHNNNKIICYYFEQFSKLRARCFQEEEYTRSLSSSADFIPVGGKSGAYFAKTFDDRFFIKEIVEAEFKMFDKLALGYFFQLRDGGPTSCLARIFGVYGVIIGKKVKNVVVMENLKFGRILLKTYDLKGSENKRLCLDNNAETLLDQNFIQTMKAKPMYLTSKDHEVLNGAVALDSRFLSSYGVMDYSLLVGINEENNELVVGIIDYLTPFTYKKNFESIGKSVFNIFKMDSRPTVIRPPAYKIRFGMAISNYFHEATS